MSRGSAGGCSTRWRRTSWRSSPTRRCTRDRIPDAGATARRCGGARSGAHRPSVRRDAGRVDAYLDFALEAPAMLLSHGRGPSLPFGEWLALANPTLEEWDAHLSTLFPEVRPSGHLELRSADAVDAGLVRGAARAHGRARIRAARAPRGARSPASAGPGAAAAGGAARTRRSGDRADRGRPLRAGARGVRRARCAVPPSRASRGGPGLLRPLHSAWPLTRGRSTEPGGGGLRASCNFLHPPHLP